MALPLGQSLSIYAALKKLSSFIVVLSLMVKGIFPRNFLSLTEMLSSL